MEFKVGHPKVGGKKKGTKNKATLLMEERRAIFDEEVAKDFLKTIKKARPEYKLDQFLGKAPDKISVIVTKLIKLDE